MKGEDGSPLAVATWLLLVLFFARTAANPQENKPPSGEQSGIEMTNWMLNKNPDRPNINPRVLEEGDMLYSSRDALVNTPAGRMIGHAYAFHRAFLGIPYALPPTGARRWRPPVPLNKLHHPGALLSARAWGHHCHQIGSDLNSWLYDQAIGLAASTASEDCLNLNVFTPNVKRAIAANATLPVLFFVHGGMHTSGGSSASVNNPVNLVQNEDIIVVTAHMRLGLFGFMASRELEYEAQVIGTNAVGRSVGNYGILDVIEALRWVRRNIASFGGDPDKVTLMGFSSGASVVSHLQLIMALPEFENEKLFSKVILSSGSFHTRVDRTVEGDTRTQPIFDTLIEASGCKLPAGQTNHYQTLSCLRAQPAGKLQTIVMHNEWLYAWGPTMDGQLIPKDPALLVAEGMTIRVPMLGTASADDGSVFPYFLPSMDGFNDFRKFIGLFYNETIVDEIVSNYVESPEKVEDYFPLAVEFSSDLLFRCPVVNALEQFGEYMPVYYHLYTDRIKAIDLALHVAGARQLGVFHGADVMLLFNGVPLITRGSYESVDSTRKRIMNFINDKYGSHQDDSPDHPPAAPREGLVNGATESVLPMPLVKGSDARCTKLSKWAQYLTKIEFSSKSW